MSERRKAIMLGNEEELSKANDEMYLANKHFGAKFIAYGAAVIAAASILIGNNDEKDYCVKSPETRVESTDINLNTVIDRNIVVRDGKYVDFGDVDVTIHRPSIENPMSQPGVPPAVQGKSVYSGDVIRFENAEVCS